MKIRGVRNVCSKLYYRALVMTAMLLLLVSSYSFCKSNKITAALTPPSCYPRTGLREQFKSINILGYFLGHNLCNFRGHFGPFQMLTVNHITFGGKGCVLPCPGPSGCRVGFTQPFTAILRDLRGQGDLRCHWSILTYF